MPARSLSHFVRVLETVVGVVLLTAVFAMVLALVGLVSPCAISKRIEIVPLRYSQCTISKLPPIGYGLATATIARWQSSDAS
jgi:hypothetical protein